MIEIVKIVWQNIALFCWAGILMGVGIMIFRSETTNTFGVYQGLGSFLIIISLFIFWVLIRLFG